MSPPRPLTGPFAEAGNSKVAKKKRAERKKTQNLKAAAKRRDESNQRTTVKTVLAPPSAPFAGLGGAPARDTSVKDLTPKVAVARARDQRGKQGGLLSPEQQARENAALRVIGSSKALSFRQSHDLRDAVVPRSLASDEPLAPRHLGNLTPPAVALPKASAKAAAKTPQKPAEKPERGRARPAYGARGGAPNNPFIVPESATPNLIDFDLKKPLLPWAAPALAAGIDATTGLVRKGLDLRGIDPERDLLDKAIGTGIDAVAKIPGTLYGRPMPVYSGRGLGAPQPAITKVKPKTIGKATEDAAQGFAEASNELSEKIAGLGAPDTSGVKIPLGDIDWAGINLVPPANAAGTVTLDQLPINAGLTAAASRKWHREGLKLGYTGAELDGLTGVEAIKHGIIPPAPWYVRYPQNAAVGLARQGAAPVAIRAALAEGLSGNSAKAAKDMWEAGTSEMVGIGRHPIQDMLLADPFGTVASNLPALKGLGVVGHLRHRGRVMPERIVKLHGGEDYVSRGPKAKNSTTAIGQNLSDWWLSKSAGASRREIRKHADADRRHTENTTADPFVKRQVAYGNTAKVVGRDRVPILKAYAAAGGEAETGNPLLIRDHYVQQARFAPGKQERSVAEGQAKFWQKVHDETRNLTDEDRAFIEAHRDISAHTSEIMGQEAGFGPAAIKYRKHELQIIALATKGDQLAQEILQMRHERYGTDYDGNAPDMRGVAAQIRVLETEKRKVDKQFARAQNIVDKAGREHVPGLDEHKSAYAEWKAGHDEVMAREPQVPEPNAKSGKVSKVRQKAYDDAHSKWNEERKASLREKPKRSPELTAAVKAAREREQKAEKQAKPGRTRRSTAQAHSDRLGAKIEGLKARIRYAHEGSDPGLKALDAQLSHSLDEFAKRHTDAGGSEPVRFKYTLPPPRVGRRRSPTSASRWGSGAKRTVKASTGYRAQTGEYLISGDAPIVESVQAQRILTSRKQGESMYARGRPVDGVGRTQIGPDEVFVSDKSMSTIRRVENNFEDNPVAEHDFHEAESKWKDDLRTLWKKAADEGGTEHTPPGVKGVLIKRAEFDRVMEYMKPADRNAYDRYMQWHQRQLISTYPGTLVGNTFGTLPMAMAGMGHHFFDPRLWQMAAKSYKDKSIVPYTASRHGLTSALKGPSGGNNRFTRYQSRMRELTMAGEDFSKHLVYWRHAFKQMKKDHADFNLGRAEGQLKTFEEFAREAARMEGPSAKLADRALVEAEHVLGEAMTPEGRLGRNTKRAMLFHRWAGHVLKLMLYRMPIHHPGMLALMNGMAIYGDQWRKEHGVWPEFMKDFAAVSDEAIGHNVFTRAISLSQFSPQNTAGNFMQTLFSQQPWAEKLTSLMNPVLGIPLSMAFQEYDNYHNPTPDKSVAWTGASSLVYGAPFGLARYAPRTSRGPGHVPWIHPQNQIMTDGTRAGPYNDPHIDWEDRPGMRPLGQDSDVLSLETLAGVVSRMLSMGVVDVPAEGQINRKQNRSTETKAKRKVGGSSGTYAGYGK